MRVKSLHIYPVKSLRAVDLDAARVTPQGLAHDRRWMLVNAEGKFLSQREIPKLSTLSALPAGEGLRLEAEGFPPLAVAPAPEKPRPVKLWKEDLEAYDAGDAAAAWFSNVTGTSCRLVFQGDRPRKVDPAWSEEGDLTGLSDGFPLLIVNTASLDDLNARGNMALPMDRFRSNVVIEGAAPWAEDTWKKISIGGIAIDIAKPCLRCVITTTDQTTGERWGQEPLQTLKTFRLSRAPGLTGVAFGQNGIPRAAGLLKTGDSVDVLETQTAPAWAGKP